MIKNKNKKNTEKTRRGFGRGAMVKPDLLNNNSPLPDTPPNSTQHDSTRPIPLTGTSVEIKTAPIYTSETQKSFTHVTQIRIDSNLFASINNAVESAIFGGNYDIESASHFVREALREHASGKPLQVAHGNGAKKSLSIRLDEALKNFWDTLPKRHRNNILERAIRTKLLSYHT